MIRDPLAVGAIAPSSRELAKLMVDGIQPDEGNIVLELGVGTGAITEEIRRVIPSEKCYLGFEIDPRLAELGREKFPELKILNADACSARERHAELELGHVKYIISGIPVIAWQAECSNRVHTGRSERGLHLP